MQSFCNLIFKKQYFNKNYINNKLNYILANLNHYLIRQSGVQYIKQITNSTD